MLHFYFNSHVSVDISARLVSGRLPHSHTVGYESRIVRKDVLALYEYRVAMYYRSFSASVALSNIVSLFLRVLTELAQRGPIRVDSLAR